MLSIEGQRQAGLEGAEGEQGRAHRLERSHGPFRRSFTLPATVDAARVDASYQDGVLIVKLPRREESRPQTDRHRLTAEAHAGAFQPGGNLKDGRVFPGAADDLQSDRQPAGRQPARRADGRQPRQ